VNQKHSRAGKSIQLMSSDGTAFSPPDVVLQSQSAGCSHVAK